ISAANSAASSRASWAGAVGGGVAASIGVYDRELPKPANELGWRAYPRRRAHLLRQPARGVAQKTRDVHRQHRRYRTSARPTRLPTVSRRTPLRSNALTQTRCTSGARGSERGLSERFTDARKTACSHPVHLVCPSLRNRK